MGRLDSSQNESIRELMELILSLQDMDECDAFFRDLCTMQELILFSQRLQVAKRLLAGETYDTIRSQVQVSSATITRINTALQFGTGGYRSALERSTEKEASEEAPQE